MFFILSKTLGALIYPSRVITLIAVAGLVLLATRFARAGRRLLWLSLVLVLLLGALPIGKVAVIALEQRFPRWAEGGVAPAGFIVLGGAVEPGKSAALGMVSLNDNAERVTEAAALARRFPDARIVFSGGSAALISNVPPESAFMLALFDSFGIARSRVTLEERSRNTHENAVFTKALVDPKPGERWLLVTSAMHMPRAVGVFRRAGFEVEAYPVDRRLGGWGALRGIPWPLKGLDWLDDAAKEWVGLIAYWLAGYTSELLPGPRVEPVPARSPTNAR
jgi:uncharacterized SAM-binding protein YcdF (DUF218 family)